MESKSHLFDTTNYVITEFIGLGCKKCKLSREGLFKAVDEITKLRGIQIVYISEETHKEGIKHLHRFLDKTWSLVLSSLNAVTKESAIATMILGRASPDPGFGSQIELRGRDAGGLLDLLGVGKALPGERIAAEEAPPALLQVQPARSGGNEDLMDARVIDQPGAGLEAVVTREIVSDDEDIPARIVGFDVGEQGDVALGVARGGTAGQLLAITYPQCPVDPGFLGSALIVKWRFDAVSSGGPAWGGGKGARHYWSEFVGTDGRRPLRWLRVVGDDRRPFGTKSLSRGVAQLWVCRHRTPSRRRMRRI